MQHQDDHSDEAQYRLIIANSGGSATSAVATLTVYSALHAVTVPTDSIVAYQPNGGSSPGGEAVRFAIDESTSKYLNFGAANTGFIVTPSKGRTFVTVIRLYAANDAIERDPANSIFEGSNDGGTTWTLISSNAVAMPDTRNGSGLALDPLTLSVVQIRFTNTNSYSIYRWYQTVLKTPGTGLMQIGEVELLGTVDNRGLPFVSMPPTNTVAYLGTATQFYVGASGNPAPTYQWMKGTTALQNGGNISGATSSTLTINNLTSSDAGSYYVVVRNTQASVNSSTVTLTVISPMTDVTQPGDEIVGFGDQSGTLYTTSTNAANAIDNLDVKWQNGGSGFSTAAGFPPFQGPVGLIVKPTAGLGVRTNTLVTGLRLYTADANIERDPADFTLEGSNDDTTFKPIASGAFNLPFGRNNVSSSIDPVAQDMQEVLFSNIGTYTSYRITFNHVRNDSTANSLQFGEIELLGVVAGPNPTLTYSRGADGKLTLTTSIPGTLQSTTALKGASTQWVNEGPITGTVVITPSATDLVKLYRIVVP